MVSCLQAVISVTSVCDNMLALRRSSPSPENGSREGKSFPLLTQRCVFTQRVGLRWSSDKSMDHYGFVA
jgi:hypothetical protein